MPARRPPHIVRGGSQVKHFALAGRYARALADLAGKKDPKQLETVAAQLDLLARVFGADTGLLTFFDNVSVRQDRKEAAIKALADKAKLSDLTRRFLILLMDKQRMAALPAIAFVFGTMKDEALGIIPAETTVAVRLSEAQVTALRAALEKMTGRKVRLSVTIDPAVLGGARTRVGSRVYDGTLRSRLQTLRRRMTAAG